MLLDFGDRLVGKHCLVANPSLPLLHDGVPGAGFDVGRAIPSACSKIASSSIAGQGKLIARRSAISTDGSEHVQGESVPEVF
jgi:hypothetical protein